LLAKSTCTRLTASGASETEKATPGFLLTQAFEQLCAVHQERTTWTEIIN